MEENVEGILRSIQDSQDAGLPNESVLSSNTPEDAADLTDDASERPSKEDEVNFSFKAADISGGSSGGYILAKKTKRRRPMDSSTPDETSGALIEDRSTLKDILAEYRRQNSKIDGILKGQQEFFSLMKNFLTGH